LSISPSEIVIHPDWNPFNRRYDADIAAMILDDNIPYTKYIRPICIPSIESKSNEGWISGWGKSEDPKNKYENIPKQLKIPIHDNEHCFLESVEFTVISSRRTICGGAKDKKGPCHGDSGGGLYVKKNNIYYLKGIVSASLSSFPGECDVTRYALYTNVEKFIDWIKNPVEEFSVQTTTTTIMTTPSTTKKPIYNNSYESSAIYYPSEETNVIKKKENCGKMSAVTSLIQGGNIIQKHTFPWTVAIFFKQGNNIQYFSTGTLISRKHILTTGLSVANFDTRTQKYIPKGVNEFQLYFGVSDLHQLQTLSSESFVEDGVEQVILHPNIQHGFPRISNIGVLKIRNSIVPSSSISQICLPDRDFNYQDDSGKQAYAVGWGQDETGYDSRYKKYAKMPIRDQNTCEFYWNDNLRKNGGKKFFCAGGSSYDSACYRDQPLYVNQNGVWMIRGLISIAQQAQDGRCDLNKPVLYEDVGQYRNWLQTIINES
jgi:secreted trypsin-like serine protease